VRFPARAMAEPTIPDPMTASFMRISSLSLRVFVVRVVFGPLER
jgi:hypothetical protein